MNLNELKESIMDLDIRIKQLEAVDIYEIRLTENLVEDVQISLLGDSVEGLLQVYRNEKVELEQKMELVSGGSFVDYSGLTGGLSNGAM